ncbi:TRAP transporter substrate-binding protein [Acuticoccus kandeliae]|uniref:TRAP transporter substrate-binding protein n=1 Tax=Acuticoccus kandeliae TaxID=2073160 RepID=UPI0013002A65|nr:TRAP transporter substrate-binding protein [Acuticoccus kandeliae]
MKSSKISLLAAAALAAILAGPAAAETSFKLSAVGSPGTPEIDAAMKFAELIGEKSNGEYRIDVLHSGQAGGEREIAEGMQFGTTDFAILGGIVQNFDPALMIVEWDLLFKNNDHVRDVMNGPIGDEISERLQKNLGAIKVATFMRSPRLLTTNAEVDDLDDIKGMKIRVPEMPARIALWRALGAQPTPMAFPEVVPALQLGTIDGQENPIGLITSTGIDEAVDYLADTKHLYGFMLLLSSESAWDRIPAEDQAMFKEAAAEAAAYNDELVEQSNEKGMEKAAAKMTVTQPDLEAWRAATADVYKQFETVEGFSDLYNRIVEAGQKY